MPSYPYQCPDCKTEFSVDKQMSESSRAETCPECEATVAEQSYAGRRLNGFVSSEGNWSGGKAVFQLHPKHPDYVVTSKKQMEDVYKKNRISMETGQFKTEEDSIRGTVPRKLRTRKVPTKSE